MHTAKKGICGWELTNPDPDTFLVQVDVEDIYGACRNCEHVKTCQVPGKAMRRLVPKEGELIALGGELDEGGDTITYFAVISGKDTKFLRLTEPEHYWAKACYIQEEELPSWALSRLKEESRRITTVSDTEHKG